jgi:hypothetical protein
VPNKVLVPLLLYSAVKADQSMKCAETICTLSGKGPNSSFVLTKTCPWMPPHLVIRNRQLHPPGSSHFQSRLKQHQRDDPEENSSFNHHPGRAATSAPRSWLRKETSRGSAKKKNGTHCLMLPSVKLLFVVAFADQTRRAQASPSCVLKLNATRDSDPR